MQNKETKGQTCIVSLCGKSSCIEFGAGWIYIANNCWVMRSVAAVCSF